MKLQIADQLALPIEAVTEKLAFLGRTGSGLSWLRQMGVITERSPIRVTDAAFK